MVRSVWVLKHLSEGWKHGQVFNPTRLLHPSIVPWDSLPSDERARETESCSHILATMGAMGYRIIHTTTSRMKYEEWCAPIAAAAAAATAAAAAATSTATATTKSTGELLSFHRTHKLGLAGTLVKYFR